MKCVACQKEEATQKHHLSYEPEIVIDICVSCHKLIHKHGVGNGRDFIKVDQQSNENIICEGTHTIFRREGTINILREKGTEEVLTWLKCTCGNSNFHIYKNDKGDIFLWCEKCSQDWRIKEADFTP